MSNMSYSIRNFCSAYNITMMISIEFVSVVSFGTIQELLKDMLFILEVEYGFSVADSLRCFSQSELYVKE